MKLRYKDMTQVTPQAPIDPLDTKIPLTIVIEKETQLFDRLWQMSLLDDNRKLIYISPFIWIVWSGYIPTDVDLKKNRKDDPYLVGWLYKHLYARSKDWERQGMPSFPRHIEYCSMTGQDLENDHQAWEGAPKFYDIERK